MARDRRVTASPLWWMLALFALVSALVVPYLEYDALSGDELRTILAAGGAHHGPLSFPLGVIANTNERSPDQALGFPLVAKLWGDYAGWTEFPLRVFSYLTGLLVIAMTYRVGQDLFAPFVGLGAAVILGTSVFFNFYMHKFRVFTLVPLAVAITIWCYWRLVHAEAKPGWLAAVGLVVGGVGLTYTHYFVTPFIGALGLFHLLFARPINRRWWYPVGLFAVVMLLFLPQLGFVVDGYYHNAVGRPDLRLEALSPLGVVERLTYFFGHGFHALTLIYLGAVGFALTRYPRQTPHHERFNLWLLAFSSGVLLIGIITMNEIAGVMPPRRVRYMMGLWVPLAVLFAAGMWKLGDLHRYAPLAALAVWAGIATAVSAQGTLMIFDSGDNAPAPAWREMVNAAFDNGEPDDAFVYLGIIEPRLGHYTHEMPNRHFIPTYYGEPEMREAIEGRHRVWFVWNRNWDQTGNLATFYALLDTLGFDYCETYLDDNVFQMRLYATSQAFCPGGAPQLAFGDQITLMQTEEVRDGDQLTLNTGWALTDAVPQHTYSVGFHIYDADGDLVAQQDIGLNDADGPYLPLQAQFDLSDLNDGEYEVRVVVYNWQTGERLMGTNMQDTAIVGEVLLLERFVV